ncbi:MAG TPA: BamA/TamA family outer membrane protein [Gemmatimonadota bacterium]|nr:BamA/TamA family outer membrane protein [Gemmatimonadota bacterium]
MTPIRENVLRALIALLVLGTILAATAPAAAQDTPGALADTTGQVLPPDHPLRPQPPPGAPEKGETNPIVQVLTAPLRLLDGLYYRYALSLQEKCGTFAGGITGEGGLAACGPKHVSYHFGSLGSKSGFWGLGFGLHTDLRNPTGFKAGFTAAATWRLYQEYTAYVGLNDPARRPYARLTGFYDRDTRNRFFGLGPESDQGDESDYSLEQFGARAEIGVPPRFGVWGNAGARYEKSFVFEGEKDDEEDTIDEFPAVAGVLDPQQELWGPYANVVLDLTDATGHPTAGVKVKGRGALYRSVDDQDFNWLAYGAEVQGHLPLGSRWHILSALVGFDTAEPEDDEDVIPFVYLPSLGGSTHLRGHESWRFVDRTAGYGTVEYRYRIWQESTPDLDRASAFETAIFYDVGGVGEELGDIDLTDEDSYGAEIRVYIARKHLIRVGIARSDEGTRLNFRFSDVY